MKYLWLLTLLAVGCTKSKDNWQQTNGPYGGIINCIASEGNYVFAGTDGAGVFFSNDDGSHWTKVNKGLAGMNIHSLVMHEKNIYAGTDSGLFLSSDFGKTWTTVKTGFPYKCQTEFLVTEGNRIFALTCGLVLSEDNGKSWTSAKINGEIFSPDRLIAVGETEVIAFHRLFGLCHSHNRGYIWDYDRQSFQHRITSFAKIGTSVFAGTAEDGIFCSTDTGRNWTAINNGLSDIHIRTISVKGTNIYAGTLNSGVFLSTDNGKSWKTLNEGLSCKHVRSLEINGSKIYAGTDAGMFLSTDLGRSWKEINNGLINTRITSLALKGRKIFAGTYGNGVFQSSDNGKSWIPVNKGLLSRYIYSLLVCGKKIYAATSDSGVFVSSNNGYSWTALNNGLVGAESVVNTCDSMIAPGTIRKPKFKYYHNLKLCASESGIYAWNRDEIFFRAYNHMRKWSRLSDVLECDDYVITALAINDKKIYKGTYRGVFLSEDSGNHWISVTNDLPLQGSDPVYMIGLTSNKLFASVDFSFYSSDNGGKHWTKVRNDLPEYIRVWSMESDKKIILVATNYGIYKSSDQGTNWDSFKEGLPGNEVWNLKIKGRKIFAGTDGCGVYKVVR